MLLKRRIKKHSRHFVGALFVVAIGGVIGCSALMRGITTRGPDIKPAELYGTWQLNNQSSESEKQWKSIGLVKSRPMDNQIELRADGSCHFKTYSAFHPDGEYLDGEGRWVLKKDKQPIVGETQYLAFDIPRGENEIFKLIMFLKQDGSGGTLYHFFDDPDANHRVTFSKVK